MLTLGKICLLPKANLRAQRVVKLHRGQNDQYLRELAHHGSSVSIMLTGRVLSANRQLINQFLPSGPKTVAVHTKRLSSEVGLAEQPAGMRIISDLPCLACQLPAISQDCGVDR